MRSVTFVQRISIELNGSVAQNAVLLADVDNDDEFELIIGTMEGDLNIYKGASGEVWKRCSNLGLITAIGVGDLLNKGRNVLVLATGCGWLYIFDFLEPTDEEDIEPSYRQRVPANIRDIIISDINDDGRWELIMSLTDRVVRMYRWNETVSPEFFMEKRDSREMNYSSSHNMISTSDITPSTRRQSSQLFGRFLCINKWEFASQIGTVSFNMDSQGNPAVLIGQPGGAFLRLCCKKNATKDSTKQEDGDDSLDTSVKWEAEEFAITQKGDSSSDQDGGIQVIKTGGGELKKRDSYGSSSDNQDESKISTLQYELNPDMKEIDISSMTVEYEPMGIQRRANPNVSSEILGGFKTGGSGPGTRYAIVTLDGSVLLVDDIAKKKPVHNILWNLQVDHQLMCLSKVDITGDGLEEVVCCSWDGETYIISQGKESVRFQFEEAVSTFTAGKFTLSPGNTQPVLVYVTFSNKIQIYFDLCLAKKDLTLSSLIHYPSMKSEAAEILKKLGCEPGNLTQLRDLYNYCLYTLPNEES